MNPSPTLRLFCAALGLLALLAGHPAHAQPVPPPAGSAASVAAAPTSFARFDLDFPGGTPAQLVAAITQASKQPLNVIIAEADADAQLPALRLKDVTVPKLFSALGQATGQAQRQRQVRMVPHVPTLGMNFITQDENSASPSSIWFFWVDSVTPAEPITRFYSLAQYLQLGLTVDDITTAIRTGWEMRGDNEIPALKFHAETQILIAVGRPEQLAVIVNVLEALMDTIRIRASVPPAAPKAPTPPQP